MRSRSTQRARITQTSSRIVGDSGSSGFCRGPFVLGVAFIKTGFPRGALLALDRVIKLQPDYSDAYYNKGVAFQDLERHYNAILSYRLARAHDRELTGVNYPIGRAFEVLEALDSARVFCRNAV